MSIMTYNGGVVIAMKGKGCVAVATDRRLGNQGAAISKDFQRVFEINSHNYVGFAGLATDIITVSQRLKFRVNLYELRENRRIRPKTLAALLSNMQYERRFGPYFVEPVVAGIDPITNEPFISGMDVIGCAECPEDFVVSGTCTEQAFGVCETFWQPNLGPNELFEVISQCLISACDRDAISGLGGIVYIIEKDKVTIKKIKTRMD